MKYWDTSAILRTWKEGWVPATGMTRLHSIAEWVSIQTGRGLVYQLSDGTLVKRNLSAADGAKEARRVFANFVFHELTPEDMLRTIDSIGSRADIAGVAVHDFIHARVAELYKAESIVTINARDFSRMTQLPLETPTKTS